MGEGQRGCCCRSASADGVVMIEFEFWSRYGGPGAPLPDPETMCKGQCEGTGWVPIMNDNMEEPWRALWLEAEAKNPTDDGTHFVKCPECGGTGKC